MDQNKLRTLVFEKTGIRIDTMDPVFALVALNEAVLEESVSQQAAVINAASDRLSEQADRLLAASERYTILLQRLEGIEPSEPRMAPSPVESPAIDKSTPDNAPSEAPVQNAGLQRYAGTAAVALATAILTVLLLWMTGFRSPGVSRAAVSNATSNVEVAVHGRIALTDRYATLGSGSTRA